MSDNFVTENVTCIVNLSLSLMSVTVVLLMAGVIHFPKASVTLRIFKVVPLALIFSQNSTLAFPTVLELSA